MAAMSTRRRFEILDRVLDLARENDGIRITDAATVVGVPAEDLRQLLREMLLVEFRTEAGDRVSVADGYYLGTDDELIVNDDWLGRLERHSLDPDRVLRLSLAASVYRRITPQPLPVLRDAIRKLDALRGIEIVLPVELPDVLDEARRAVRIGTSLRFHYLKPKCDTASEREILPYGVYHEAGHWYAYGPEIGLVGEFKQWRFDRMTQVSIGEHRFDRPRDPRPREHSDLSALTRRVEVRLPAHLVRALPEPHTIVERSDDEDGFVRMTIDVIGDAYLDHLLIALGPRGEVISPPEYRERRRARARLLLAHIDDVASG